MNKPATKTEAQQVNSSTSSLNCCWLLTPTFAVQSKIIAYFPQEVVLIRMCGLPQPVGCSDAIPCCCSTLQSCSWEQLLYYMYSTRAQRVTLLPLYQI